MPNNRIYLDDYGENDCQKSLFEDQEPVHTVILESFWIDKTEVSNAMYRLCVEAGECDDL